MTGDGLEGTLAKLRRYLRPVLEGAAVGDADAIFRRMDKAIAPTPAGALAKSAIEAVEKAGGSVSVIEVVPAHEKAAAKKGKTLAAKKAAHA